MPQFWIDTDVYLQAANDVLAFDATPEFWTMLEERSKAGIIGSPRHVCIELVDLSGRDDAIAKWAAAQREAGLLFHDPDESVLANYTKIADYVHSKCDQAEGDRFLNGADPWVIAHAMAGGTVAVSQEKMAGLGSKLVKIPNICVHFNVACIKTDALIRELRKEKG
jgi:hypothetical protein